MKLKINKAYIKAALVYAAGMVVSYWQSYILFTETLGQVNQRDQISCILLSLLSWIGAFVSITIRFICHMENF